MAALTGEPHFTKMERGLLRRAMACSFIWPRDEKSQTRAQQLGLTPDKVIPLRPGQSLMVSVGHGSTVKTNLWLLSSSPPQGGGTLSVPMVQRARDVLQQVTDMATLYLPMVASIRPLKEARSLTAWHVFGPNGGISRQLDGASYGLAMLLGVVSLWQDRPLPGNLCALATVDLEGRLGMVGGLKEKMATVATCALGVGRVIVAPEQQDEAEQVAAWIRRSLGSSLEVMGDKAQVSDLLPAVLPASSEAVQVMGLGLEEATQLSRDYYMLALEGTSAVLDWRGVKEGTRQVLKALPSQPETDDAKVQAGLAHQIAARHSGDHWLMEWPDEPWLAAQPRPLRLTLLAHVVQSAADGSAGLEREYADRALRLVAPHGEEHAADLKLLGAAGRALASAGVYRKAAETLDRAVRAWFALHRPGDASYALSEWLRVLGCMGALAAAEIDAADEWVQRILNNPRTTMIARAFVLLSAGRARICAEQPEAGIQRLAADVGGVQWKLTQWHLQLSRLRWLARGQEAAGGLDEAKATREALEQRTAACGEREGCDVFLLLSRLDEVLARGADPNAALSALRGSSHHHEVERVAPAILSMRDQARKIADCYRY